jgi:hypothetical protein
MSNITKQLEKLAAAPAGTLKRIAKTWVLFCPSPCGSPRFSIDGQEFRIEDAATRLAKGDAK